MLENPTPAPPPDSSAPVKRYALSNQRNRSLNRRKSDRFDRNNVIFPSDGKKNQQASRIGAVVDVGDAGTSNILNEDSRQRLIPLEGCSHGAASQLLNGRWATVMHSYNNPATDLSERPVMYSGNGASAWGQHRLPHQLMSPPSNIGPQMDFLSELRRAICVATANSDS